jgi:hypothetical protein
MEIIKTRDTVKLLEADLERIVAEYILRETGREVYSSHFHITLNHHRGESSIGAVSVQLKFDGEQP